MRGRSWWWLGSRNGGTMERKMERIPCLGVNGGAVAEVAAAAWWEKLGYRGGVKIPVAAWQLFH